MAIGVGYMAMNYTQTYRRASPNQNTSEATRSDQETELTTDADNPSASPDPPRPDCQSDAAPAPLVLARISDSGPQTTRHHFNFGNGSLIISGTYPVYGPGTSIRCITSI